MSTDTQSKPFWKSKIVLFSGAAVLVFGSNLLAGGLFRSGVTQEQIEALQQAYPAGVEIVEGVKAGENISNFIGVAFGAIVLVLRAWFTKIPLLKG
jgi:hypothetical protein